MKPPIQIAHFVAIVAMLAGGLTANAALTINAAGAPPVGAPVYLPASSYTGNPTLAQIATAAGYTTSTLGNSLYKFTPSTLAEDPLLPLANSYTSVYTAPNPPSQPYQIVDVSYDGSPDPFASVTALMIKDGAAGAYVWNLGPYWDGKTTLHIVNNFFTEGPGKGIQDISHLEFYGTSRTTTVVPEPSTYVAGGLALVPLLLGLRSRLAKKA